MPLFHPVPRWPGRPPHKATKFPDCCHSAHQHSHEWPHWVKEAFLHRKELDIRLKSIAMIRASGTSQGPKFLKLCEGFARTQKLAPGATWRFVFYLEVLSSGQCNNWRQTRQIQADCYTLATEVKICCEKKCLLCSQLFDAVNSPQRKTPHKMHRLLFKLQQGRWN